VAVNRALWWVVNRKLDSIIAPAVNELRGELGLPPVRDIVRDWWHSPTTVIGLFPPWYGQPQADWPAQTQLTGFPLYDEPEITPIGGELDRFIDAGAPPIAFTPGSAMWLARPFFDESVEACVRLKRRGILLSRHRDHLPPSLPSG